MTSIVFIGAGGAGDLNLVGSKLGVVEKEGSLGGGFLLEGHGSNLGRLCWADFEVGDFTTGVGTVSWLWWEWNGVS